VRAHIVPGLGRHPLPPGGPVRGVPACGITMIFTAVCSERWMVEDARWLGQSDTIDSFGQFWSVCNSVSMSDMVTIMSWTIFALGLGLP
jgi:hypothetical protein